VKLSSEKLRLRDYCNKWEQYEWRKRLWEEEHPEATHEEYQRAMKRIADELGL